VYVIFSHIKKNQKLKVRSSWNDSC